MVSSFRKKSVHICMSFCGYTSPDLLVHIEVFSFFSAIDSDVKFWSCVCTSSWSIWSWGSLPGRSSMHRAVSLQKAGNNVYIFHCFQSIQTLIFFISPLSQFLWTIWSEGALCRPSTAAEHSVKGASVAWTALHRKPIVGYEVWTREQTGSEPCRKPADSTCAQCFHFKRQLHPPMTKVLRKLLSLSEAAQRLQPFSNNHDILCWSLELFELWGYFFLASPLFCCGE